MSWFTYKLLHLKVFISPIFLGAVEEGIRVQLRSKVFRWIPELNGVFLAWKDISIMTPTAAVYGDVLPLIEVPVSVKALMWCPEKGGVVQGVLAHKGSDFIAARVLGLWNAVIVKSHCNFLDKDKIKEGSVIRFRIQNLQVVNNLLSIEGSLLGDDVGVIDDDGNLQFPKSSNATVTSPPIVSLANSKKRPRSDELDAPAPALINFQSVASPSVDAETAKKKRKLHEGADVTSPSKKDKKSKDKKEKEKSKHKSKDKAK